MDDVLSGQQRGISRRYIQRISNLIKLKRLGEAADTTLYLALVLRMWSVRQKNVQEAAAKELGQSK